MSRMSFEVIERASHGYHRDREDGRIHTVVYCVYYTVLYLAFDFRKHVAVVPKVVQVCGTRQYDEQWVRYD